MSMTEEEFEELWKKLHNWSHTNMQPVIHNEATRQLINMMVDTMERLKNCASNVRGTGSSFYRFDGIKLEAEFKIMLSFVKGHTERRW